MELKNWIEELEKSKAWLLEQIEFKDKKIKESENELNRLKKDLDLYKIKNDKLMILKNYYEQPFYKRLFSKKPI